MQSSLALIHGSTIDYQIKLGSSAFTVLGTIVRVLPSMPYDGGTLDSRAPCCAANPNADQSCGCGVSFTPKETAFK